MKHCFFFCLPTFAFIKANVLLCNDTERYFFIKKRLTQSQQLQSDLADTYQKHSLKNDLKLTRINNDSN